MITIGPRLKLLPVVLSGLLAAVASAHGQAVQTVQTVREAEFRTLWADEMLKEAFQPATGAKKPPREGEEGVTVEEPTEGIEIINGPPPAEDPSDWRTNAELLPELGTGEDLFDLPADAAGAVTMDDGTESDVKPEEKPFGSSFLGTLRDGMREGPLKVALTLQAGWEFSEEGDRYQEQQQESTEGGSDAREVDDEVNNSFFLAPAGVITYSRDTDIFTTRVGYSAGYRYYLNEDFNARGGTSEPLSQSATVNIGYTGGKVTGNSTTNGSYGQGYDLDSDQTTRRLEASELLTVNVELNDAFSVGVDGSYQISRFEDLQSGRSTPQAAEPAPVVTATETMVPGGTTTTTTTTAPAPPTAAETPRPTVADTADSVQDSMSFGTYAQYRLTDKTAFRLSTEFGRDTQDLGLTDTVERSYYQFLASALYDPTDKTSIRAGAGWSNSTASFGDGLADSENSGVVYNLRLDYLPTEKTTFFAEGSLQGINRTNTFSTGVSWRPRDGLAVDLTGYRNAELSNSRFAQERVSTGAVASVSKEIFKVVTVGLSGGWEQGEYQSAITQDATTEEKEDFAFISTTVGWKINDWMRADAQLRYSTTSRDADEVQVEMANLPDIDDGSNETRASVTLTLTY